MCKISEPKCKRVDGFYSINYTRHQVVGVLLRMPLISGGNLRAARPENGQWTFC